MPTRRRTASSSSLPASLQNAVPSCAQSCLAAYIKEEYLCAPDDVSCFCDRYSTQGFSLGEIAYMCVYLECPKATTQQERKAYGLCAARASPVSGTHRVLTLPATAPPTSSTTTTSATQSVTFSSAATTTTTAGATVAVHSTNTRPIESHATNEVPQSATSSSFAPIPRGSSSLTSAQATAVAIGAIGALVIVIVAAYFCVWMRRRRGREMGSRRSYDFVDDASANFDPFSHRPHVPCGPLAGLRQVRAKWTPEKRINDGLDPDFPAFPPPVWVKEFGEGSPHSGSLASHRSNPSMRTVSQLLPDKPGTKPLPSPAESEAHHEPLQTPATIFEEERGSSLCDSLLPGLPSHPAMHKQVQPKHVSEHTRSPVHNIVDHSTREHNIPPPLWLQIPKQAARSETIQAVDPFLLPPPLSIRHAEEDPLCGHSNAISSRPTLLDHYVSAQSGSPGGSMSVEEDFWGQRPLPATLSVTKPTYPPPAMRGSIASNFSRRTSFESTDPDEPTPPEEEDRRLTPVAESPIAALRYPKIPRSSNQNVPRSPVYRNQYRAEASHLVTPEFPTRTRGATLSGSTLAVKQPDDTPAPAAVNYSPHMRKNDRVLELSGPRHHESPLKGYGRLGGQPQPWSRPRATADTKPPESRQKPSWERELTPSRQGDELYINLTISSPLDAHFRGTRPYEVC